MNKFFFLILLLIFSCQNNKSHKNIPIPITKSIEDTVNNQTVIKESQFKTFASDTIELFGKKLSLSDSYNEDKIIEIFGKPIKITREQIDKEDEEYGAPRWIQITYKNFEISLIGSEFSEIIVTDKNTYIDDIKYGVPISQLNQKYRLYKQENNAYWYDFGGECTLYVTEKDSIIESFGLFFNVL